MSEYMGEHLITRWDDSLTFPFVEDQNANITGYGHTNKAEFAAAVDRYDEVCNGEPSAESDQWTADAIGHKWALLLPDDEYFTTRGIDESTPGAFPITTLWNQR